MEYTSLPSSSAVATTSHHDVHPQYPANLHLNSSTRRDSNDSNDEFSLPPPSPMHVPPKKLIFGLDKQKLYALFKQFTNSRLFLLITIYIGGLVLLSFITIFKGSELVKFLTWSKESIQKHTKLGTVILFAFCFISCFPPFIGHGFAGLFAGYIFGLWKGFLIIYPSTVLGILGCYWMGRLMFYSQVQSLLKEYPTIKKVDKRIETDGIKLVVLLRLGTYPFSWLNLMFSAISIPFYQYFWIVLAIDVRVILTIYIGTTLDSLLDIFHSGIRGNKAQLFGFIVGMAFMVISSVYTVIYFRKCLKEGDAAEELENESLAHSGAGLGEEFDVPLMRIEDSHKGEKVY